MRGLRPSIACAAVAICSCNALAGIGEPKDFAGTWAASGTELITKCNNGNTADGPVTYEFEFVREESAGLVGINRAFTNADGSGVCAVRLAIAGARASLREANPTCTFRLEGGTTGRTTYDAVDFDLGGSTGTGALTIRGSLVLSSGVECASYTGTFTMSQIAEAN